MKTWIVIGLMGTIVWLTVQFPHTMINPGELVQEHQHIKSNCNACHTPFSGVSSSKCISCHAVATIGKDSLGHADSTKYSGKHLFHQQLIQQSCTSCHTDHKGIIPANKINSFSHEMIKPAIRNNCNSCHAQPKDTIHSFVSTTCNRCHNTNGWKNDVQFNHDQIVATVKSNCIACHQKPADDFHLQTTGSDCLSCHTIAQWKPASFNHDQYFSFDKHHTSTCNNCHTTNNYKVYTCYSCHEHNEANIKNKHDEEGIVNITDCASCHRSGNEHNIRSNEFENIKSVNQQEAETIKNYIKKEKKKERAGDDD